MSQRLVSVLACTLLLLAASATPSASRELLQEDDVDLLGLDDSTPELNLVSNNTDTTGGRTIPFLYSTLETDTTASFDTPWREGRLGNWRDGNTRWNVTLLISDAVSGNYTATLQSAPCANVNTSTLYSAPGNNTLTPATIAVSGGVANFSMTYPFLVGYDMVESVAIYSGSVSSGPNFLGCVNMVPPPPDFPSDWSATVEINIAEWGLTLASRQMYSKTLNKARMDFTSTEANRIILTDYNTNELTFIRPANATYPHGMCNGSEIPDFLTAMSTDDTNTSLLDTSAYLRFDYSKVSYVPGHVTVRGIECEQWAYDTQSAGPFAGNFTMTFAFPVNWWRVAGRSSNYHRLLKEIHVTGTTENGNDIDTRIEYVNFKPQNFSSDSAAFDVCALAPQGSNCNCTAQQIAALNGLQLNTDPDAVVIDNSTVSDQNGNCELQSSSIPHGFISQQAGPYVGLVIIGMVAGGIFTFLGTWLYYRRSVGVQLTDRMSHTKFDVGT
ncbi:hypothetical protein WJX73_004562 [Symbiochloris irregularis]|uniref:LolA-like domain-containing protein n=1 Tax=Symbiochloris irregularis TaxID=706552 RepID=A0AAW1Q2I6_9CHLO